MRRIVSGEQDAVRAFATVLRMDGETDPAATILAVRRGRPLVAAGRPLALRRLRASDVPAGRSLVPLGGGAQLLEVDADASDAALFAELGLAEDEARFGDVMFALGRFEPGERETLLRAIALAQWSHDNRFCSNCGATLAWEPGARTKLCANAAHPHRHFPRTDPATIVLVTHGERALLGRQKAWPPGMYSTLAGFVEPGETIEAGVAREVFEETGVRVSDVAYVASESWPFPRSLMLGFTATAATTEIVLDGEELEDARWFERAEAAAMQDAIRTRLPDVDTIARRLISTWLSRST